MNQSVKTSHDEVSGNVSELIALSTVDEETCDAYEELYIKLIEPTIKLKYLSHLVSAIEDMINDKFKKKNIPCFG